MIDMALLSVIRRWALRDQLSIREISRKRDRTTACCYAATSCDISGRHFQGRRSSIWLIG
ncbi:MAG: hypothetical protein FJX16_11870 [Alphaproteobacteria bacterium]|nr:hypothetical protein [Alphaproteobacteria bacterium]